MLNLNFKSKNTLNKNSRDSRELFFKKTLEFVDDMQTSFNEISKAISSDVDSRPANTYFVGHQ